MTNERQIFPKPWGFYDIIHREPGVQVKRLYVQPEHRISLQTHEHRSEHWYIIDGFGYITIDDNKFEVTVGDSVTIAPGERHRVEGGPRGIAFIEIQRGEIIDEDDIVRIEDDYGRDIK
jgi:mannose-6-phosphate isomerase-like protein (cupin superfamily)